jgi:hypothetical protein
MRVALYYLSAVCAYILLLFLGHEMMKQLPPADVGAYSIVASYSPGFHSHRVLLLDSSYLEYTNRLQ